MDHPKSGLWNFFHHGVVCEIKIIAGFHGVLWIKVRTKTLYLFRSLYPFCSFVEAVRIGCLGLVWKPCVD